MTLIGPSPSPSDKLAICDDGSHSFPAISLIEDAVRRSCTERKVYILRRRGNRVQLVHYSTALALYGGQVADDKRARGTNRHGGGGLVPSPYYPPSSMMDPSGSADYSRSSGYRKSSRAPATPMPSAGKSNGLKIEMPCALPSKRPLSASNLWSHDNSYYSVSESGVPFPPPVIHAASATSLQQIAGPKSVPRTSDATAYERSLPIAVRWDVLAKEAGPQFPRDEDADLVNRLKKLMVDDEAVSRTGAWIKVQNNAEQQLSEFEEGIAPTLLLRGSAILSPSFLSRLWYFRRLFAVIC